MTRNWLVLILLLASTFVRSQEYLNEILPREGHNGLWGLTDIIEHDSNIWCVGGRYHNDTGNAVCVLIRLHSDGEIDTTILVTNPSEVTITPRIAIHSDEIYVLCNYKSMLSVNSYTPLLIKYDLNGHELWRQFFTTPERVFVNNIMLTSDDNLILSGSIRTHPSNDFPRCFFVRKVSFDGEEIWNQTFWPSFKATSHQVIETSGGGFMISGQSQRHFSNEYQFRVIKTNSQGNVIWDKDLGVNGLLNNGGMVSELPDGTFIGTTSYENSDGLRLARNVFFDSLGNILKGNSFQYGNYATFSYSCSNNDGTFNVTGIGLNQFNEQYINLLKFDPMGNIIWQREYTNLPDWPSVAYTLKKTDNNGLLFAGSTWVETEQSYEQRAWLVKTDCFGCDSLLCYYADSSCLVYDCSEYPTHPEFAVSDPVFSTATGTTFTFSQTDADNTTMRYWDLGDGTTQMSAQSITHTYTQAGTYTVKLRTHHSACYEEYEQTVVVTQNAGESYALSDSGKEETTTSLGEETKEQNFKLYPNPADLELYVEFPDVKGSISIINLLGQAVFEENNFSGFALLDVSNLKQGSYLLRVHDQNGQVWTKPIIIQ